MTAHAVIARRRRREGRPLTAHAVVARRLIAYLCTSRADQACFAERDWRCRVRETFTCRDNRRCCLVDLLGCRTYCASLCASSCRMSTPGSSVPITIILIVLIVWFGALRCLCAVWSFTDCQVCRSHAVFKVIVDGFWW